jgi:hypothetical protein
MLGLIASTMQSVISTDVMNQLRERVSTLEKKLNALAKDDRSN